MAYLIYFSRRGEQFINGQEQVTDQGNTEIVAEGIARKLGITAIELAAKTAYPLSYQETLEYTGREKKDLLLPPYKPLDIMMEQEDEIFLGYPIWWGTFPMIVAKFLKENDLSGKTIYPFCTHEGSALGSSVEDLRRLCPNSLVQKGLAIRGTKAKKAEKAIEIWLMQYHYDCYIKKKRGR